jgi:hypothetical protein
LAEVPCGESPQAWKQINQIQIYPNQIRSIQIKSNQIGENFIQIKSNEKVGFIWISGYLDKPRGCGLVQSQSTICPAEPAKSA